MVSNNSLHAKLNKLGNSIKKRSSQQLKENQQHLVPIKHKQRDFFIVDMFDTPYLKDDIASMEHPLFALKAGDKKTRTYQHNGITIVVAPNAQYGMATIYDKDIWIYCVSKLVQAINDGKKINRTVRFTIYDFLVTTNRAVNGTTYENAKNALDRLSGTRITTNIETAKTREARGFGLVDSWKIVEEKDGRMVRVEVTLPEWLFRSIQSKNVLTISPDYFRLRKPLDRRIYELARKHCGSQSKWLPFLDILHKKSGSTATLREFRRAIKSLSKSDELPEYHIFYDEKNDQVLFSRKENQFKIKDI